LQITLKSVAKTTESATKNIGYRFVVADLLATDLSVADFAATKNPLLIL
jgi:hypothetical protein